MKNILKLLLLSSLTIVLATGCGCEKKDEKPEDELKVNTNEGVVNDQQLDAFKFENISLIYENGNSVFETVVTNVSAESQTLVEFKMHVKDSEGNEIIVLTGHVGSTMEPGTSKTIKSTYFEDITEKAVNIEYEVIR